MFDAITGNDKVKEAMERDLSNIKFDFEKFTSSLEDVKQGLNERLRQWADYEAQLEKLMQHFGLHQFFHASEQS